MMRFLATILLPVSFAQAQTTHYISPTGSDGSGTGSVGNPWQSLYKATSTVTTPGDTIFVNAGTYTETVQSVLAPGVSITGAGNTSVIKSTLTAVFTEIINMRSVSEGTAGNQSISYIKMDGDTLTTSWGICVAARSGVTIHHCEFVDFRETAVNFSGITAPTGAGGPAVHATGNSFHDNVVYNCSSNTTLFDSKYGKGCLQFGGQDGFLCYNNDIQQPHRVSSNGDDVGWPVKMANEGYTKGCKVFNNILKRAPIAATNGDNQNWNFSFEMWNVQGGLEIYNNILQGEIDLADCYKYTYPFAVKIYNNTSSQPALSAFQAYAFRLETDEYDIEIFGNIGYNLGGAIVFNPKDYFPYDGSGINVHRINIHGNLFYNMGVTGGGGTLVLPDNRTTNALTYFDDVYFDNNTLIAASGSAPHFGIELPSYEGAATKRIYCRNNHFEGFSINPVLIGNGDNLDSLFLQNNNFYNNGSNSVLVFSGAAPTHYTNSGNTTVAPNLNGSYQPNVGSPLIDAGLDIGYAFNGGAPDKGYYETGGADVTPPTLSSSNPTNGATGTAIGSTVTLTFSESLNAATVTSSSAYIDGKTCSVSHSGGVVTLTPTSVFSYSTTYTWHAATAIQDAAGNALATSQSGTFTTAAAPAPAPSGSGKRTIRTRIIKRK